MEVIAHRVLIGETGEVGRVTLLYVVEAHRSGALPSGQGALRIFRTKGGRLYDAVRSGAFGDFHPWEQSRAAAGRVFQIGLAGVAVQLLPHLVETMHWARGVRIVGKRIAVS